MNTPSSNKQITKENNQSGNKNMESNPEMSFLGKKREKDIETPNKEESYSNDACSVIPIHKIQLQVGSSQISNQLNKQSIQKDSHKNCHICKKNENIFSMVICGNVLCGEPFCYSCLKNEFNSAELAKLNQNSEEKPGWACFVCKQTCNCSQCKMKNSSEIKSAQLLISEDLKAKNKGNIISIPNVKFQTSQDEGHVVKIEDYIFIEKEVPNNEFDMSDEIENKITDNNHLQIKINENEKLNAIINKVEQVSNGSTVNINFEKCVNCNNKEFKSNQLLKFTNVEDFIYYVKFIFEKNASSSIISNSQYLEKNKINFYEFCENLDKMQLVELNTEVYMCKECLMQKLNDQNGLISLFQVIGLKTENKTLTNSSHKVNDNLNYMKKPDENFLFEQLNDSKLRLNAKEDFDKILNENNLKNLISKQENYFKILTNQLPNINDINLQQLLEIPNNAGILPAVNQLNNPIYNNPYIQNNQIPSTSNLNNIVTNFNKIVEGIASFNSKHLNHNQSLVSNVSQLTNLLSNYLTNPNENDSKNVAGEKSEKTNTVMENNNNEIKQEKNLNNEDKKEDATMMNMMLNVDQNKNQILTYMMSVLEDLKKQIVSIQYYSLLQKLFISHIFKNLENFMEQITNVQNVNEISKNGSANMSNLFQVLQQNMNMSNLGNIPSMPNFTNLMPNFMPNFMSNIFSQLQPNSQSNSQPNSQPILQPQSQPNLQTNSQPNLQQHLQAQSQPNLQPQSQPNLQTNLQNNFKNPEFLNNNNQNLLNNQGSIFNSVADYMKKINSLNSNVDDSKKNSNYPSVNVSDQIDSLIKGLNNGLNGTNISQLLNSYNTGGISLNQGAGNARSSNSFNNQMNLNNSSNNANINNTQNNHTVGKTNLNNNVNSNTNNPNIQIPVNKNQQNNSIIEQLLKRGNTLNNNTTPNNPLNMQMLNSQLQGCGSSNTNESLNLQNLINNLQGFLPNMSYMNSLPNMTNIQGLPNNLGLSNNMFNLPNVGNLQGMPFMNNPGHGMLGLNPQNMMSVNMVNQLLQGSGHNNLMSNPSFNSQMNIPNLQVPSHNSNLIPQSNNSSENHRMSNNNDLFMNFNINQNFNQGLNNLPFSLDEIDKNSNGFKDKFFKMTGAKLNDNIFANNTRNDDVNNLNQNFNDSIYQMMMLKNNLNKTYDPKDDYPQFDKI